MAVHRIARLHLRASEFSRAWRRCAPLSNQARFVSRHSSSSNKSTARPPVFELTDADVYPFGISQEPLFRNLSWTVGDTDCWAIMAPQASSASSIKSDLVQVVQAHARVSPTRAATYPLLRTLPLVKRSQAEGGPREPDISDIIHFVSFKTRLSRSGDFDDYTARYGSIRDEDRLTVRQHLEQSLPSQVQLEGARDGRDFITETAQLLQMDQLLDLPLITLSNGQTRRARILRALLHSPELLILEEPFSKTNSSMIEPHSWCFLPVAHCHSWPRRQFASYAHRSIEQTSRSSTTEDHARSASTGPSSATFRHASWARW